MKIRSAVDWFVSRLWILIVVTVLLLAVYVALGRQALSLLPNYRVEAENFLSEKLEVPVVIDEIYGKWDLFSPSLIVKGVAINPDSSESLNLPKLGAAYVEVEVLATLLKQELRFGRIHIEGLHLGVQRDENGGYSVIGLPVLNKKDKNAELAEKDKGMSIGRRIDAFLEQGNILFSDLNIDYFERGRNVTVEAEELRIGKRAGHYELKVLMNVQRESTIWLEMTAIFEGKPNQLKTLNGEAYLKVLEGNFASWLPEEPYLGLRISNVDLSTELWADVANGKLIKLLGSVEAKNVTGSGVGDRLLTPLDKVSAKFSWNRVVDTKETGWHLVVHRFDLDYGEQRWRNRKIVIASNRRISVNKSDQNIVHMQVNEFSVAPLVDMAMSTTLLTPEQRSLITALAPEGGLKNTSVKLVLQNNDITHFYLKSDFQGFRLTATGKIPGFENLSGYIDTSLEGGVVDIDAVDPVLDLTTIMRDPIPGLFIKGPLRWQKNKEGVFIETGVIHAETSDIRGEVMASLQFYQNKSIPFLRLHAGLFEGDGSKISTYLPAKKIKKNLLDWLDNGIVNGHIVQGDILYNGPVKIDPNFQTRRTIQMRFQVDHTEIEYLSGWPKITDGVADVIIRARETEVQVSSGRLSGAQVNSAFIHIPAFDIGETPRLFISGNASGDISDGLLFLRESPLEKNLSGFIHEVSAKGEMNVKLDLGFSLAKQGKGNEIPMKTDVWIDVSNSELQIKAADLGVLNVQGRLTYSAKEGLKADKLKGRLFNRNVVASIKSTLIRGKFKKMDIAVNGSVDFSDLNAWAKQPILNRFSGATRYKSVLHFWADSQGQRNSIDIRSNLKGVSIDMPPPLYKAKTFSQWTKYSMTLGEKEDQDTVVEVASGENFNLIMAIDKLGVERGKLSFSSNKAELPNHPGLIVDGHLNYLDIDEWSDFFDQFDSASSPEKLDSRKLDNKRQRTLLESFRLADLHVDVLEGFGQVLDDVNGQVMYSGDTWLIALQNRSLSALFRVPSIYLELEDYDALAQTRAFPDELIDADFIYLRLPAEGETEPQWWAGPLPLSNEEDIDPLQFPPFKVRVRELMLGDDDWGRWRAKATLTDQGLLFKDVVADFKQIHLKGDVLWEKKGNHSVTEFSGVATTNDVAKMTNDFGYDPTIASTDGVLNLVIHWQGSPIDFEMTNCTGNMALAVKNGQLLSVDNAASSVRVIGLLNFETLGRRLKLDFGDLYKKGLAFDTFGGNLSIKEGLVKTDNFSLKGPSTQMEMKGTIDINTHAVFQRIEVTLPVGRHLVLPVAVVGGLPLAATLYVVDKAIGDQLNKLTTIRFQLKGNWDDPKVTSVKLFK
ncbi:MAG: TIGR02099 family protein [Pseudomonadales bacterium]|nr:TIGR02099 family protein [Pseudomonadales bacterium]